MIFFCLNKVPGVKPCPLLISSTEEQNSSITTAEFRKKGIYDHPWATTALTYFRWNELENLESDGIDKIIEVCNMTWSGIEEKNVKVIPRVYLHWSGDKKYCVI